MTVLREPSCLKLSIIEVSFHKSDITNVGGSDSQWVVPVGVGIPSAGGDAAARVVVVRVLVVRQPRARRPVLRGGGRRLALLQLGRRLRAGSHALEKTMFMQTTGGTSFAKGGLGICLRFRRSSIKRVFACKGNTSLFS